MYDDTIAEFQRSIALSERSVLFAANLGYVYAVSGQKKKIKSVSIARTMEPKSE